MALIPTPQSAAGGTKNSVRAASDKSSSLQQRPGGRLRSLPLSRRHQHCRFNTPTRDHLRPLCQAGIEEFTVLRLERAVYSSWFNE